MCSVCQEFDFFIGPKDTVTPVFGAKTHGLCQMEIFSYPTQSYVEFSHTLILDENIRLPFSTVPSTELNNTFFLSSFLNAQALSLHDFVVLAQVLVVLAVTKVECMHTKTERTKT